ncbi:hypothetical protein [Deinococcus sp. PESE-13]
MSARLFPPDAETLKGYGSTSITLTLLAQGLQLGEGNLPALTDDEIECLQYSFFGMMVDIFAIRILPQVLPDLDHPASESLSRKLTGLGDFELLALVLRHVALKDIQIMRSI